MPDVGEGISIHPSKFQTYLSNHHLTHVIIRPNLLLPDLLLWDHRNPCIFLYDIVAKGALQPASNSANHCGLESVRELTFRLSQFHPSGMDFVGLFFNTSLDVHFCYRCVLGNIFFS